MDSEQVINVVDSVPLIPLCWLVLLAIFCLGFSLRIKRRLTKLKVKSIFNVNFYILIVGALIMGVIIYFTTRPCTMSVLKEHDKSDIINAKTELKNTMRLTTRSATLLESQGWGKYLYKMKNPQDINASWLTLTDGALYRKPGKIPVILKWTTEQHHNSSVLMKDGLGHMASAFRCPYTNCVYTDDTSKYMQADAIVFFQMEFHPEYHPFPPRRLPHQRYVFLNRESPQQISLNKVISNKTFIQGFYNWTATYRIDSDIHAPYLAFYKRIAPVRKKSNADIMQGKKIGTKMVAWFVTNCHSNSLREDYAKELTKYINVDVYGKCGPLKCGRNHNSRECYKLLNNYWFYLSFENALCTDYVTEKVLFPLDYAYVVPVVFGAADYSKHVPPHSVINIMDFKSPKVLATYLHSLMGNVQTYLEYFAWKPNYRPAYAPNPMCHLCERLNERYQQGQVYTDFISWWKTDKCDINFIQRQKIHW